MNKWSVQFETHSRGDVMKVCALLAKGVGKDTLSERRVQIKVAGPFKIGKSAIADGLASEFVDGLSAYHLDEEPLLEKYTGEAMDHDVVRKFEINQVPSLVTLARKNFAIQKDDRSVPFGIDFVISVFHYKSESDISIRFNDLHEGVIWAPEWERTWQISIHDEGLRTPQMAEILDHLRHFHERRQSRRAQYSQAEPS